MKRLILHIGHSKCASSTLQGYLSTFPVLRLDGDGGGVLRYVAAGPDGDILHGEALSMSAAGSAYGYAVTDTALLADTAAFRRCLAAIRAISSPQDIVVLSCENWGHFGSVTDEVIATLDSVEVPVDVFMLVRPPVEWVNAAWWQWAAWTDEDPQSVVDRLVTIDLRKAFEAWRSLGRIERAVLRDVSQGPVKMFLDFAGASMAAPVWEQRLNVASDFDLLRHLLRNRERYGRTVIDPSVEFQLNAVLSGARRPLPFVLSRGAARQMVERGLADNISLLAMIQEGAPALDPAVIRRYLDPSAYDHLPEEVNLAPAIGADYSDSFVAELVSTILWLQRQIALDTGFGPAIAAFDGQRYLELNPDVKAAGMNPYEHYLRFGFYESRRLR